MNINIKSMINIFSKSIANNSSLETNLVSFSLFCSELLQSKLNQQDNTTNWVSKFVIGVCLLLADSDVAN